MGVGGGQRVDAGPERDLGEDVVAGRVERVTVVPQLDGDVIAPEDLGQAAELGGGGGRTGGLQGGGHRPLATPGENQPVPLVGRRGGRAPDGGQLVQGAARRSLLPSQLGFAQGSGQQGVAPGIAGDDDEVGLVGACSRVGLPHRHSGAPQGDLGSEDGGQAHLPSCFGEADDSVEAVVVGDGQRLEAEAGGLLDEDLGRAGPVEEAEVGVAVQLGVGHRALVAHEGRGFVGRALARPCRAVAAVAGVREGITPARVGRAVGEGPVQLRPRHRWVHPAHGARVYEHPYTITNRCSIPCYQRDRDG